MVVTGLLVETADPSHADARALTDALRAELGALYDDEGAGAFSEDDVRVPRSAFLLARLEGRPVACGALCPCEGGPAHLCEIKRMFVVKDARGKGISRAILWALEEKAASFGYAAVRLETGLRQPEAINLYVKSGYSRIPRYGRYANQPMSACFEKKVAPPGAGPPHPSRP